VSADVELSVTVSRDSLGLPPLEIATSMDYYLGLQFLGANVTWQRQQVESQWLDGAVTTSRHRGMVTEQIAVEVTSTNLFGVQARINELIQAFTQDSFNLTVIADGATRQYRAEAADYQDLSWTTPRMAGAQGQILLSVPRQPVALIGSF
jgi:hypothetical protein